MNYRNVVHNMNVDKRYGLSRAILALKLLGRELSLAVPEGTNAAGYGMVSANRHKRSFMI